MSHLALVFGVIGRLYAIRCALDYDLRPWAAERPVLRDPATNAVVLDMPGPLWHAAMRAWRLSVGLP